MREDRGKQKKEPREPREPRQPRQQGEKPARKPRAPRDENEVVPENNIIFVGNLPWDVDSDALNAYFPGSKCHASRHAPRRACRHHHLGRSTHISTPTPPLTHSTLLSRRTADLEANVQTSRDGRSAGYGLVTYDNVALATDAITLNNGMDIGGRTVFCRYDRGKTPKFNDAAEY